MDYLQTGDFVSETECRVAVYRVPEPKVECEKAPGVYLYLSMTPPRDPRRAELRLTPGEAAMLAEALTRAVEERG